MIQDTICSLLLCNNLKVIDGVGRPPANFQPGLIPSIETLCRQQGYGGTGFTFIPFTTGTGETYRYRV